MRPSRSNSRQLDGASVNAKLTMPLNASCERGALLPIAQIVREGDPGSNPPEIWRMSVSTMASSWALLAATWHRMSKDSLSILAAGIAFQTFFSLFPTLTAVVSLYGLVADRGMVERQIEAVQGVLPPEAVKLISTWLQALVQGRTTKFGIGLIISVVLAVWSMWSATGMLMTAVNICYGEDQRRGFRPFNLHAFGARRRSRTFRHRCICSDGGAARRSRPPAGVQRMASRARSCPLADSPGS